MVKGAYRNEVSFEVLEVNPASHLQVSLGTPMSIGSGKTIHHRLTIKIDPDVKQISRRGGNLGVPAHIVLKNNSPVCKRSVSSGTPVCHELTDRTIQTMALKSHYIQCSIFLCLIGIGCCLVTGCGDDTQSEQIEGSPQISYQSDDIPPEPETGSEPETQHAEPSLDTNIMVPSDSTVLFDGWTKPSAVLVFTGRQFGYIEPCGCTGLERQKGGLARRYTFLDSLRGNVIGTCLRLIQGIKCDGLAASQNKFNLTSELLGQMQYAAVGLGPADLKLPAGELFAVAAVDDNDKSMFVSSNVAILDRAFTRRFQLLETPAGTIGLASVISEQWLESLFNDDLIVEETDEALRGSDGFFVSENRFQSADGARNS